MVGLPFIAAIGLSFTEFSGVQPPRFTGFENFSQVLGDRAFWRSAANSGVYVMLAVPLRLLAAVACALLLFRRSRGVPAARAVAYLPSVVPDAAYALLWLWILNPLFGPLAALLAGLGFGAPGFLTDPWATRAGIALMGGFQIGEAFVVALAARRTIPPALHEAAAVDGASPLFSMTKITLPLMAPVLALLALRDVVLSLHVNFVPALLVTDGGPRYATTYLPLYVYRQAFTYFRLGYASAISVTLFLLTVAVVFVQYRLARRWRLL